VAEVIDAERDRADPLSSGPLARWLAPTSQSRLERIDIARIVDRTELVLADPDDRLVEHALMVSIRARGVLEPLLLRPAATGFEVVQGARRLRAARQLAITTVPAIVRELGDAEALIAGPWQSLVRRGLRTTEAPLVTARLLRAGVSTAEGCALVSAAPRLARPALIAVPALRGHRLLALDPGRHGTLEPTTSLLSTGGPSRPVGMALPERSSPLLPALIALSPPVRRRGVAA